MLRAHLIALACVATAACSTSAVETSSPLEVSVEQGVVEGRTMDGARAWFAIPYAAAPVGDLRWQAPQPLSAFDGIAGADAPGAACAQPDYGEDSEFILRGEEDCLTLNIYAPESEPAEKLPVMVWIHGGGNYAGAASDYDGSRLAASQDLIVVTANYRLGPFGWFHHEAMTTKGDGTRTTGQFAILDIIATLEWVEANIDAFGGDPDNITIFGESAGAQNVYALVLAERADGLFEKAIAQSGGFWNMALDQARNFTTETLPGTPASANEIIVDLLINDGKAADESEAADMLAVMGRADLLTWMRSLPAEAVLEPYSRQPDLGYDLPSVVLDGVLLPEEDHRAQLASGAYNKVPMIIGGNRNEQKLWQAFDPSFVDWSGGAPNILDEARYTAVDKQYSTLWNFDAVDDLAPRLNAPVFAYRFDWDDQPSQPIDWSFLMGAAHGLEIPFVFDTFEQSGFETAFTEDNLAARKELSNAMMSYWAAFAYTGDPGRGMNGELADWPSVADSNSKLIFDANAIDLEALSEQSRSELIEASLNDTRLTDADRCLILHHNSLYPRLQIDRLDAAGCEPAWAGQ